MPVRVASVFADKSSNDCTLDDSDTIIDKKREVAFVSNSCFVHYNNGLMLLSLYGSSNNTS